MKTELLIPSNKASFILTIEITWKDMAELGISRDQFKLDYGRMGPDFLDLITSMAKELARRDKQEGV